MKTIHKISAYILLALGLLHTGLTPFFYTAFDENALWFSGTGLGLVFLGLFNLSITETPERGALYRCRAANPLGSAYGILVVIILGPAPQALLALLAFLAVTLATIFHKR